MNKKWTSMAAGLLLSAMLPLSVLGAAPLPEAAKNPEGVIPAARAALLPKGAVPAEEAASLTKTAVSAAATSSTAVQDEPVEIELLSPASGQVITGGILSFRLNVKEGWGYEQRVYIANQWGDLIHELWEKTEVDLRDFEGLGQQLFLVVETMNTDYQIYRTTVGFYVEASKRLQPVEAVEGRIIDFDANRIVYQTKQKELKLKDRESGTDTLIHTGEDAYAARLTPSGVIFRVSNTLRTHNEIMVWTPQGLVNTGVTFTGSEWDRLTLAGSYTVLPVENSIHRIDTSTGNTVSTVTYGLTSTAVEPQGSTVFAVTYNGASGIYRWVPGGSTEAIAMSTTTYDFDQLVSDGHTVVFREGLSRLLMYKDGQVTEIKPAEPGHRYEVEMIARRDFDVNDGWITYNQRKDGVRQMFQRSPAGQVQQITDSYGLAARLHSLQSGGAVSIIQGDGLYVYDPGAEARVRFSNRHGIVKRIGTTWYKGWETTLMKDNGSTVDDESPTWSEDALQVTYLGTQDAKLHWKPAADNVGVTEYSIFYLNPAFELQHLADLSADQHEYLLTDLSPDPLRIFIHAKDAAGNSGISNDAYAYAGGGPPSWTEGSKLTVTGMTYRSISLQWPAAVDQDNAWLEYLLYLDGEKIDTIGGESTEYTLHGLMPGRTYTFELYARDGWQHKIAQPLSLTVTTPAEHEGPALQLIPQKESVRVGSTIDVLVRADQLHDLNRFMLRMEYDAERLKLVYANMSSRFGKENVTAFLSRDLRTPGQLGLHGQLYDPAGSVSGEMTLIHMRFQALQPGDAAVKLLPASALTNTGGNTTKRGVPAALQIPVRPAN